MQRSTRKLFQGVFGALVLGTLGFGATQALADARPVSSASACNLRECFEGCQARYGEGTQATCSAWDYETGRYYGYPVCQCIR